MFNRFHIAHSESEWFFNLFSIEETPILCGVITLLTELIKIFVLLFIVLFLVSFVQTFVSMKRVKFLANNTSSVIAVLFMTIFGFIAPTCICTAIPIIIGMITLGIPVYAAMTFLISSSLINVSSIVMMLGIMGSDFTLKYILTAILATLITGIILSFLNIAPICSREDIMIYDCKGMSTKQRLRTAFYNMLHSVQSVWIYVVIGVLLAVLFEMIIPHSFFGIVSSGGIVSVFIAILIGVVVHTDIIAILPIVETLSESGVSIAILFSLICSVAFFSIPTFFMLASTIRKRDYLKVWIAFFLVLIGISIFLYFII